MGDVPQYWAFISYSHVDRKWAKWLHRSLENYAIPRHLVGRSCSTGKIPKKIRPVFRDRDELPVSADLSTSVREALQASRYLIVVCSPDSAQSKWVNQEVREFIALKGPTNILCVIAGDAPSGARDVGSDLFPEVLKGHADHSGSSAGSASEPMAADLRPEADGKRLGKLKLIAGMLDLGLDELIQRDLHRRHGRMVMVAAASVISVAVMGALTLSAFESRREEEIRKAQAQELVEFMLGDLSSKLESVSDLDTLASLSERALQYYASMDPDDLEPDDKQRRARALLAIGEIEALRGSTDEAADLFEQAHKSTADLLAEAPDDTARIFDHAQSIYWLGYIEYVHARPAEAEIFFTDYLRLSQQLVKLEPGVMAWQKEVASAHTNLGVLQLDRGELVAAMHSQSAARDILKAITSADPGDVESLYLLANAHAWLADVEEVRGNIGVAFENRSAQTLLLEGMRADDPGNTTYIELLVGGVRSLGRLWLYRGNLDVSEREFSRSIKFGRTLVQLDPSNAHWREITGRSIMGYIDLLLWQNRSDEVTSLIAETHDIADWLVGQDERQLVWQLEVAIPGDMLVPRMMVIEGRSREAVDALDGLIVRLSGLANQYPENRDISPLLAAAHLLSGDARAALDERAEAEDAWRRAVATLAKVTTDLSLVDRAVLALGYLHLNEFEEASRLANELERLEFRHPMTSDLRRRVGAKGAE